MIHNQRVIWSDNGTEKDLSVNLNQFRAGTEVVALTAADDYIIIGADFPFNHKYFLVDSANAGASAVTVEYWDGSNWRTALDVIDCTADSGVTMAASGVIQWRIDRDYGGWIREDKSSDVEDLAKTGLYDMFWLRLSFSGDITTTLKYVGNLFCATDDELYGRYPDLNRSNLKVAFEAGKTTWLNERLAASEEIVTDLRRRNIICSSGQIMSWELFQTACIHKTAEIVFAGMGRSYDEDRKKARKYYDEAMNISKYEIDLTRDGDLSTAEKNWNQTGYMSR